MPPSVYPNTVIICKAWGPLLLRYGVLLDTLAGHRFPGVTRQVHVAVPWGRADVDLKSLYCTPLAPLRLAPKVMLKLYRRAPLPLPNQSQPHPLNFR